MAHGPFSASETEGARWVSAPCWHNCGGRCLVKALVKDGEVLWVKSDDTHEDSYDWPQARACLMGYAHKQLIYGEDRILYPMKRKHWEPGGGDRSLRGIDEWERITWDEALEYAANEFKRIYGEYGPRSVLFSNLGGGEGFMGGVLSMMGGYADVAGTVSLGTFAYGTSMYGMDISLTAKAVNDRYDHKNSDYIVLIGMNAAWCAFGNPSFYLKRAKEEGVKFVYVGPDFSATAGFTNAEWIPVLPGTDTALLLGVAHSMLTRDEDGSLVGWDFLDRCTVGFDDKHMPADARTDENFRDYVLGVYDGQPKSAEWASAICGTPVEKIHRLADIMSCKYNTSIHSAAAMARHEGAENYPQLLMTVAAMGGHFGKPGNACSNDQYYSAFNAGPKLAMQPPIGSPWQYNSANPIVEGISASSVWDAVLTGRYWYAGNDLRGVFEPGEWREIDIHAIVNECDNFLQSQADINSGIKAFRKVDFVMTSSYYWRADALYSDIVFPASTRWERRGPNFWNGFADRECAFATDQVVSPRGEALSDYEICARLAKKLGFDFDEMGVPSEEQRWFTQLSGSMALEPDGSMVPIAEVTQADLDKYGVAGSPQPGKEPFEKFLQDGVYRVQRSEGDAYYMCGYSDFVNDPEGHPLPTASGKFEIYCQAKADFFDLIDGRAGGAEGNPEFVNPGPLPKYLPQAHGVLQSYDDFEAGVKGAYPIQATNVHYLRRAHTDLDQLPMLREAMANPVFINKADADARGIANGDVIEVFNGEGSFLRPANVSRLVMPGVMLVPHGANFRIDPETGLDLAGADNILTTGKGNTTPMLDAWNSVLVDYKKYEGDIELAPDCDVAPLTPKMA